VDLDAPAADCDLLDDEAEEALTVLEVELVEGGRDALGEAGTTARRFGVAQEEAVERALIARPESEHEVDLAPRWNVPQTARDEACLLQRHRLGRRPRRPGRRAAAQHRSAPDRRREHEREQGCRPDPHLAG
jgi:hypothetical protein